LEYTISTHAKFARYKILPKDCTEQFEPGTEPVKGTGKVADMKESNGQFYSMTLIRSDDNNDDQIALVEFLPTEIAASSWASSAVSWLWSWWNSKQDGGTPDVIEFCIRMGLWLPPEAGEIEVNFRETNVMVTFRDHKSLTTTHVGGESVAVRRVDNVVLDPRPMHDVTVKLMGAGVKEVKRKEPAKEEKEDEIVESSEVTEEKQEGCMGEDCSPSSEQEKKEERDEEETNEYDGTTRENNDEL
jgi:hypothetical protein